jgi:hypothetical protein
MPSSKALTVAVVARVANHFTIIRFGTFSIVLPHSLRIKKYFSRSKIVKFTKPHRNPKKPMNCRYFSMQLRVYFLKWQIRKRQN